VRTYAPALLVAPLVGAAQGAAWFLGVPLVMAALVTSALTLATTVGRGRLALGAILLGLVSASQAMVRPQPVLMTGEAVALVEVQEGMRRVMPGRVTFLAREAFSLQPATFLCRAVELPWRNTATIRPGDLIWIRGELAPVRREPNPGSWSSWLWRRGVSYEFKVTHLSRPLGEGRPPLLHLARESIEQLVLNSTEGRRGAALLLSMALGSRDLLSKQVEDSFMELGLTHLLVVSGYQVSLVFGAVYGICRALAARGALGGWARGSASVAAILCSTMYVLLIGPEVSPMRALVAAAALAFESLTEGSARFAQRWGVSLLIVELIWPWAMLEIGVQLTFAALAGIGIGSTIGRGSPLRSAVWVQVSVWAFTSLICVAWSGRISVVGLVLNLAVAGPWSALNCLIGLPAVIGLAFGAPGATHIVQAVAYLNEGLSSCLLKLLDLGIGATTHSGSMHALCLALLAAICVQLSHRAIDERHRSAALKLAG